MPIEYPTINGVRYDFSSIDVVIAGRRRQLGMRSIEYSHTLEPTKVRGAHAQPIGRTRGEYEAEASIVLYKREADELRSSLEALGGGYMEQSFELVVMYAETGQPVIVDRVVGCRIRSESDSHEQGSDALEETLELDVMYLVKNGKNPLTRMLPVT